MNVRQWIDVSKGWGARPHGWRGGCEGRDIGRPPRGDASYCGGSFLMFALAHAAETTQAVSAAITALEAQNGGCREEGRGEGYVEYWYMNIKKKSSRGYS